MKRTLLFLIFGFLLVVAKPAAAPEPGPWGFWAHQRINQMALYTLPEELFSFYKPYIDYITEHAVDPDKRRYSIAAEAPRHYIDLDHYGAYPFPNVPHKWKDAVVRYSEDTLNSYGIVPWYIELMMFRLTDAFKAKDANKILRTTAEIGHYISDAHVPLHCTENYNGQMTNQVGIHGFWESRIPELMGENYDYFAGKAEFIPDINKRIWEIVFDSHLVVDSVLNFEKQLNEEFPSDRKYSYETRGASTVRVYSKEYTEKYNSMLNNMVERRMRQNIIDLGSFWLTAWVNAGKPNLTGIILKPLTEAEIKEMEELNSNYNQGEYKGKFKDD